MNNERILTCIICPRGCQLTVSFNEDGSVTIEQQLYGTTGSLVITALDDNVVISFEVVGASGNTSAVMYYDYGFGYVYEDEMSGYGTRQISLALYKGESYKIEFINYKLDSNENKTTAYVCNIYVLEN